MRLIAGGLDFDGADFVLSGDQEIHFPLVLAVIGFECVIKEVVPVGGEHLCNHIFE